MEDNKNIQNAKPDDKLSLIITDWKHSQSLGKSIPIEDFLKDKSNDLTRFNNFKISQDGSFYVFSDQGGRITIYRKHTDLEGKFKLKPFYDYQAQEREFDVHKSCELSKAVRGLDVVSNTDEKIDLLSSNYRNIKYDRVLANSKKYVFDLEQGGEEIRGQTPPEERVFIPKVKNAVYERKHKTKQQYKLAHTFEINSLRSHPFNKNTFLSADDYKILMWDVNITKEVYNIINIEDVNNEEDNPERITVAKFNPNDPHIFSFGTSFGNLYLGDLRISSDALPKATKFFDEGSPFVKTVFAKQLLKVHDIEFFPQNTGDNILITRHYMSLQTWDKRNLTTPVSRLLLYEPLISKLSHLYGNNYMNDKFTMSLDRKGKIVVTGGYNNMFHVVDLEQRLNTQIVIDEANEKTMNQNIIRKINAKGCCAYKKDDPIAANINFDRKILLQQFDEGNFLSFCALNCIYTYTGKLKK